jgi:hypothetical protein
VKPDDLYATDADPLHVDEEPWPYAIVEDDARSGGAIVWMLGAIVAAVVVGVIVWWRS